MKNADQVTIIGLGLIGGSLASVIKDKNLVRVVGYARRDETVQKALKRGIIDEGYTNLKDSIKNSSIIVVCTPIDSIVEIVNKVIEYVEQEVVIVDVASTKESIVHELSDNLPDGITYIGGHPMAGSERTGIDAADKNIFKDANFILTPYKNVNNQKLLKLNNFIEKLGMKVKYLSPQQHDSAVAAVSHLPYLMATNMINTIDNHDDSDTFLDIASTGFKDTTRVASSSAVWGKNICLTNRKEILNMIGAYRDNLDYLESLIKLKKEDELVKYFESAKKIRNNIK
jgi:prephenate dehydrogenase